MYLGRGMYSQGVIDPYILRNSLYRHNIARFDFTCKCRCTRMWDENGARYTARRPRNSTVSVGSAEWDSWLGPQIDANGNNISERQHSPFRARLLPLSLLIRCFLGVWKRWCVSSVWARSIGDSAAPRVNNSWACSCLWEGSGRVCAT